MPDYSMANLQKVATPMQGISAPAGNAPASQTATPDYSMASIQSVAAKSAPINGPAQPASQTGGFMRNLAAAAISPVQDVANLGKSLYEKATNPAYAPTTSETAPLTPQARGREMPNISAPDVPPAQIPGVSNFIKNTSTTTPMDYLGQGVGSMLPFVLAPETDGPALAEKALKLSGVGATSGLGSYAGTQIDPDAQRGALWGALVGGGVGAGLGVASKLTGLGDALSETMPVTKDLQKQYAANKINQFAPNAASDLQSASSVTSAIPGGQLSAAQATQSPELARLEGALVESGKGAPLAEQQIEQGNQRAQYLNADHQNAQTANLSTYLDQARATDDENATSAINVATQSRNAALNEPLQATEKAKSPTAASVAGVPNEPEQIGDALRAPIAAGNKARQIATSRLYQTLDDKNPALNVAPMADAAKGITDQIKQAGLQNVSPAENAMYARAAQMGTSPSVTWKEINGFRSELNQAVQGETDQFGRALPSQGRLMALKRATDQSINTAVDRAVQENPDEWSSELAQQANLWKKAKTTNERQSILQSGEGRTASTISATTERGQSDGAIPVSATSRTTSESQSGLSDAASASRVAQRGAESSVNPAWSQDDVDTYRNALKSHAQRMGLYWNDNIGKVLATNSGGDYRMPSEGVIKSVLPGGDKSRQVALTVRAIAKDRPAVLDGFGQAVALNLRKTAVKDGVNVDPSALAKWQENHAGMLKVFPEIAQRVKNIAGAQSMVDVASAARETAMEKYNHTAIAGLLNGDAPEVAMQKLLSGSPQYARQFVSHIQGNAPALAGARKAMANYLTDMLTKTNGDASDARVQAVEAMLRDPRKKQVLNIVMGPQAEPKLRAVADNWRQTNTAAIRRNPNYGSPTAFNKEAIDELNAPKTWIGQIARDATPLNTAVASMAVEPHSGAVLAAAEGLGALYRKYSASRIAGAQQTLAKILTSPETTAKVLEKYSKSPAAARAAAATLARTLAATELKSYNQQAN